MPLNEIQNLVEAYYQKIPNAERHEGGYYVTLYCRHSWYGGPEEGGWWGEDIVPEASQHYDTREEAERALLAVTDAANAMSKDAERQYGNRCIQETAWLDARGLDDSFLPEVAGADGFFAVVERQAGAKASKMERGYC